MPFKTPYGKHYHTVYGCHGATESCSTAGLSPCSDCCGRDGLPKSDVTGGGSGAAGIAGVPQEAITGEMLANEFGQDYDESATELDNAASFIRLMSSAEDRERAARAVAVGMAERDFEQRVMQDVDLIEGEVAMPDDVEAIEAIVRMETEDAIRTAYREQARLRQELGTDALDPDSGPLTDEAHYQLTQAVADRLEEKGVVPWLSPSIRERISNALDTPVSRTLAEAFDGACTALEFRRGILPDEMPVATMATEIGSGAIQAGGQDAPEVSVLDEDDGIQRFDRISAVNGDLRPTDYGDGFDVGDVVTYNSGYSMILPHFAFVVRRTPKMIETIDLPTVDTSTDGYGQMGYKRPVGIIDLSLGYPTKKSRMRKGGSFSIDGHWTHPWEGDSKHYDYMD